MDAETNATKNPVNPMSALSRLKTLLAGLILAFVFALLGGASGCGMAIPFSAENKLGPATIDGTDEVRSDGGNLGTIYPVTMIVQGGQAGAFGITGWNFDGTNGGVNALNDFPFPGAPIPIGNLTTDRQTPFEFSYTYPPNNYQLGEAHLIIDTQRDNSDTEAIFVDGVFSGRPPSVNGSSTRVSDAVYILGLAAADPTKNTYYIDWSLAHYKQGQKNTFDLNLVDLLNKTAKTPVDVLNDGYLPVVTGDDSPVFQAPRARRRCSCSRATRSPRRP